MTTDERRMKIARLLLDLGKVQVGELAEQFSVSSETIRKDLIALDMKGLAKKEHGGAIAPGNRRGDPLCDPSAATAEASLCIVEKALEYLPKGLIILDGGPLCRLLTLRLEAAEDFTVLTDSLDIASICLERGINAHILGGELLADSRSSSGLWACENLGRIRVEAAFLSTGGFICRNGPCVNSFARALVAHAMIASAKFSCVLADGAAMKQPASIEYASWEEIDMLITDSSIDMESLDALIGRVEVQLAH